MRRLARYMLLAILILLFIPLCSNAASGLVITEMAVTTKVAKGKPIDSVRRISAVTVNTLYCFTRLRGDADTDTTIRHRWFRNDVLAKESELPVKGSRWRTYSSIPVDRGSTGNWRVDVVDSEGHLLKSVTFRVN